jgi:mono/diheme cytochrome c family protein
MTVSASLRRKVRRGPAIRRTPVFKKLLIAVVALGCLGLLGFGALAWRPAIAPVTPPAPGNFAPDLVAKGEALAGGGYCAACHTAKGGQTFAGGCAMATHSA